MTIPLVEESNQPACLIECRSSSPRLAGIKDSRTRKIRSIVPNRRSTNRAIGRGPAQLCLLQVPTEGKKMSHHLGTNWLPT
jgi:hypothetical protein